MCSSKDNHSRLEPVYSTDSTGHLSQVDRRSARQRMKSHRPSTAFCLHAALALPRSPAVSQRVDVLSTSRCQTETDSRCAAPQDALPLFARAVWYWVCMFSLYPIVDLPIVNGALCFRTQHFTCRTKNLLPSTLIQGERR